MSDLPDIMNHPGFQSILECVRLVVREEMKAVAAAADPTQPITAEQLCERWKVVAATKELQLHKLARLAREGRLRPLAGGKGWSKRYALTAVIAAEKILQRKGAAA